MKYFFFLNKYTQYKTALLETKLFDNYHKAWIFYRKVVKADKGKNYVFNIVRMEKGQGVFLENPKIMA